jgi:DNA-binding response OmpR family regulator
MTRHIYRVTFELGTLFMPTVLIIDDDVTLLAQLAIQLEQAGYSVLRATDLTQGEHMAADGQPDAILLNWSVSPHGSR